MNLAPEHGPHGGKGVGCRLQLQAVRDQRHASHHCQTRRQIHAHVGVSDQGERRPHRPQRLAQDVGIGHSVGVVQTGVIDHEHFVEPRRQLVRQAADTRPEEGRRHAAAAETRLARQRSHLPGAVIDTIAGTLNDHEDAVHLRSPPFRAAC